MISLSVRVVGLGRANSHNYFLERGRANVFCPLIGRRYVAYFPSKLLKSEKNLDHPDHLDQAVIL
jgi:hypothetical protein